MQWDLVHTEAAAAPEIEYTLTHINDMTKDSAFIRNAQFEWLKISKADSRRRNIYVCVCVRWSNSQNQIADK